MPKRFSRYNFARKIANGTAPAGSPLDRYLQYRAGTNVPTYTRAEGSQPGGYDIVYVEPFGVTADQKYQVLMSKRANDNMINLVQSVDVFNHVIIGATEVANINANFVPAKAIVRTSGTSTVEATSEITGQKYQKESGAASYTVPFGGKGTAGDDRLYTAVARQINQSAFEKNNETTVSFIPETWRAI